MLSKNAPAKINLGLHVLRQRPDGYHDIETVFLPIGWVDRLDAEAAPTLSLTCSDPALPKDEGNLVVRAAFALAAEGGVPAGAALHLDKQVPYGAGLGGGSSDAAAALLLLRDLWEINMSDSKTLRIAAKLGADVPFFLRAEPAVGKGVGDRLRALRGEGGCLYQCPFHFVVAVPAIHVSTAEAYRLVSPSDALARSDIEAAVWSNDLARWGRELRNDFQDPVEEAYPEIARIRETLEALGAGYAAMSGSGSAVFGAFESEAEAQAAGHVLERNAGLRVWVGEQASTP